VVVIEAPWLRTTSECQRLRAPPPLNHTVHPSASPSPPRRPLCAAPAAALAEQWALWAECLDSDGRVKWVKREGGRRA
jgi:hypothetical protein